MHHITQLGIDYLSTLDYVDMTNLCRTDRQLATICTDNTYLRRILYNVNPTIYLPPNTDIASAMNQLNTQVELLFSKNYPLNQRYPAWINKELFRDYMKRTIYTQTYYALDTYIDENLDDNQDIFDKDITLELNKPIIAFPFTAYGLGGDNIYALDFEESYVSEYVENKILLPKQFVNYIKYPILNWYNIEGRYTENAVECLKDLLFLKDSYSFVRYH